MNETFKYEWHELIKGRKFTIKLIIQAITLAILIGFGPEIICLCLGYEINIYQIRFMTVAIPVIILISILPYYNNPISDITTSSLLMDKNAITVTRHVITEKGHRYFVTWISNEAKNYKIDELHRIIQVNATWEVTAYHMKGKKVGAFVDFDVRTYPQTFQLTPEAYYEVVEYLNTHCKNKVSEMSADDYEKAKQFIHKHYEI